MATLIIRLNENTVGTQPALNFNDSSTVTFQVSNNPVTQAVDVKADSLVLPGGQVNTVIGGTNISVNSVDPANPIVNFTGTLGGQVNAVFGTLNQIVINNTDPVNPIVSLAAAVIASLILANSSLQRGNTILDGMFGLIQVVANTTYTLMVRAAYAGAITAVGIRMGAGTCTVQIRIGGTPLGGSSNNATTTYSERVHATNNVFVVNDIITMVITASAASPSNLDFVLKTVRIL